MFKMSINRRILILISSLLWVSCGETKLRTNRDVDISRAFQKEVTSDYIELLNNSCQGDSISFGELIDYDIDTRFALDHSRVISSVCENLDSQTVCRWKSKGYVNEAKLRTYLGLNPSKAFVENPKLILEYLQCD